MIKKFTLLLLLVFSVVCVAFSQQTAHKTFLISSNKAAPLSYNAISVIDINSGKAPETVYDLQTRYTYRTNGFRSYLSQQKNIFLDPITNATAEDTLHTPMGGAVACAAYDQKTNRLFYIPQHLSELRYLDLNQSQASFTYLESQSLNLLHNPYDVANQITRMTVGADGFGYALTNDGEHLIKFSTEGTPVIQDLGVLIDKPNNTIFVRSSCTSWGGDIVAAADGSLYLITQMNYVFRILLPSKVCEYVGLISTVPQGFTTNGAAADENGDLIISCGSSLDKGFHPFYKITWKDLVASPIEDKTKTIGNISDMASSNLLFQKAPIAAPAVSTETATADAELKKPLTTYTIYPNPVTRGRFTIKTNNISEKGEYKMLVIDQTGRGIMEAKMNLGLKSNTNSFTFPPQEAKGIYTVLIVDIFERVVYSQQLIVQ